MKIEELICELKKIKDRECDNFAERRAKGAPDAEGNHLAADTLLLEYIDNEEVTEILNLLKNGMHDENRPD